jgi:hypothetical protein
MLERYEGQMELSPASHQRGPAPSHPRPFLALEEVARRRRRNHATALMALVLALAGSAV